MPEKKVTMSVTFMENFALSGAAAVFSKTVAAPMERIKLLMQNQDEMLRLNRLSQPYNGIRDCALRTIRTEGFLAFWKSNFVNCLRYFPTQALNFAFKDQFKLMIKPSSKDSYSRKFTKNIFAGGAAGALTSCFVYSLDYARTRLANDAKVVQGADKHLHQGRQFNGIIDVYRKTWASDGLRGLYRGFVISVIATAVYRGFYFGLYDSLKPILLGDAAGVMKTFALSYTITVTANLIAYPMDTVRRRMMMRSGEKVKYKGSMDCLTQIVKNEGVKSAWKGGGANILRNVAGAGVLVGFDELQKYHRRWKTRSRPIA